jgi:hypothetical protein
MKRSLALWLSAAASLCAAACSGGGGGSIITPPPNNGFSNSNLDGQYAFSMSGTATDQTTLVQAPYARVGSFIADGKGDITGGVEDINLNQVSGGSNEVAITNGSYTINSDGRGTLTLNESAGTFTFSISLTSSTNGYIVDFPSDGASTASGNFVLQNVNAFNLSSFSGNYVFDFSGVDTMQNPESIVGQVSASLANGVGVLTGFADDNDGGQVNGGGAGGAAISGNFNTSSPNPSDLTSFGRGEFSIGGVSGVYYIVGPSQVKFLEETSGGTLAGDAFAQSNVTAGINGPFVYVLGGSTVSTSGGGPLARGGKFSANSGNLTSIIVDTNNAGQQQSLPTGGSSGTGTYTLDTTTGRGTMTFTLQGATLAFNYVFYMVSPTQAFVQEQTAGPNGAVVEDGSMFAQGSAISASSLAGNYALNWSGEASLNGGNAIGEEDVIGEATVSSGTALSGIVDINEDATFTEASNVSLTGTLTLSSDPTSHNALTFNLQTNPAGQVTTFAYIAANNNILFMTTESNRIAAGVMTLQAP